MRRSDCAQDCDDELNSFDKNTPSATAFATHSNQRAVVDIGSNSVRLVIYGGSPRAPNEIFNEKYLCGLGRGVEKTGALADANMAYAFDAIDRFVSLIRERNITTVSAVATAAVRDASNGPAFIGELAKRGLDVAVISGDEEARFAALGVLAMEPDARGIVGDLGGGSLELAEVRPLSEAVGDPVARRVSLSIGPLRLLSNASDARKKAAARVKAVIENVPWLKDAGASRLYLVGGEWRNIAHLIMGQLNYQLSILHAYRMHYRDIVDMLNMITRQSESSLAKWENVQLRRVETLPYSAIILMTLVEHLGIEELFVSGAGVRNGVLFDQLTDSERLLDPLTEGCAHQACRITHDQDFGEGAQAFTESFFEFETSQEARLRKATCLLADLGDIHQPDYKARRSFEDVMSARYVTTDHQSRVFIALAVFYSHARRSQTAPPHPALELLDESQKARARLLGMALRFARNFAPGVALGHCRLQLRRDELRLELPESLKSMAGPNLNIFRRLETLADHAGVPFRIGAP